MKGFKNNLEEYITFSGFVLVFFAFSLSKYKLPHYIFVLFPFAAIITADFLYGLKENWAVGLSKTQFGIMHLFWLLMLVDFFFFFPPENFILPSVLAILFILNWLIFRNLNNPTERIFIPTIITAVAFNLLMGLNFYPGLKKGSWVFTDQLGYNDIKKKGIGFKVLKILPSYRVTQLKLSFLNRKTRERQLKNDYLLEIK